MYPFSSVLSEARDTPTPYAKDNALSTHGNENATGYPPHQLTILLIFAARAAPLHLHPFALPARICNCGVFSVMAFSVLGARFAGSQQYSAGYTSKTLASKTSSPSPHKFITTQYHHHLLGVAEGAEEGWADGTRPFQSEHAKSAAMLLRLGVPHRPACKPWHRPSSPSGP